MKNYSNVIIKKVTSTINSKYYLERSRLERKNFVRKRKMGPVEITNYLLNKKGLSNKMEIINFNDIVDVKEISSPAVYKQREKFNPEAIRYLSDESLKMFYEQFENEVKTYKGYLLTAIDGSDFEVPNNEKSRKEYNGKAQNHCARITVSMMYDVLNHYTLHTIINNYNYDELAMAREHEKYVVGLIGKYKTIRIMDRNYRNLSDIYNSNKEKSKFIVRIASSVYKKETSKMLSDDEIIYLGYEYNRLKYYEETNPELCEYLKSGETIEVRCVKIKLKSGETEYLLTNLEKEKFSKDELAELYEMRWGIETNYHYLKHCLKIEAITSNKRIIIEQDILSQVLVFNILQTFINDNNENIDQSKYKNRMKINTNMAIGIFKKVLIYILIEQDERKRTQMIEEFYIKMRKFVVPIKKDRQTARKNNPKNKHHINKRKTF